ATILTGQQSVTITIQGIGNSSAQVNRNFSVRIFNPPTGITIARSVGTATIMDDDWLLASVADVSVVKPTSGTVTASFGVFLSNPAPAGGTTITYATSDGTALAGRDYL